MFASHSVQYTYLPDLFLAFDLYDTVEKSFSSRGEVASRLRGSGICQVPEVERPEVLDEGSLKLLVRSLKSRYCDGLAEGVYLRRECGGRTVDRVKIVREDFIAGDERWNRGGIVKNGVVFEKH